MGTKGSYTGGGGKPGRDLRDEIVDWLDSPDSPPDGAPPDDGQPSDSDTQQDPLPVEALLPAVGLFRPRGGGGGGDGPGGMSSGSGAGGGGSTRGGAQRSASRSASTAGRAAAAAYALRTGDSETLRELGLDYDQLRATADPIAVTQQIVAAACGPLPDGTIEDEEQRHVCAEIVQWVLEENLGEAPPTPEEIVRETIALIIFEAATTETAAKLREGERPAAATRGAERQMRQTADALARRASLSAEGATSAEFEKAIEDGIEALRKIWGGT